MPTWEDMLEGYVGLAKHFICATCLNTIFRGSTGLFGQKLILNKVAPPGGVKDESGHQITFQCADCVGREPIVAPIIHPNGEVVDHINISELVDAQDKTEVSKSFGDYDNRQERTEIQKQAQIEPTKLEEEARKHYQKTVEEIQEEHAQRVVDANKQNEEETDELED
jgi:hypothetical protein